MTSKSKVLETEMFEPLIEMLKTDNEFKDIHKYDFFNGHGKNILAVTDKPDFMESDIFAVHKNKIKHAFHVKRELSFPEDVKLIGKLEMSKLAVKNSWVILTRSIENRRFLKNIPEGIGIIKVTVSKERGKVKLTNPKIEKKPKSIRSPKYEKLTQRNYKTEEFRRIKYYILNCVETKKHPNWTIGKENRVWGLPRETEFNKIKDAPEGSIIFFMVSDRINNKTSLKAIWTLLTKFEDYKEKKDKKFKRIWSDREYRYRARMGPVMVEEFKKGLPKTKVNSIVGYKKSHMQWQSVTRISRAQYETILFELLKKNKSKIAEILPDINYIGDSEQDEN